MNELEDRLNRTRQECIAAVIARLWRWVRGQRAADLADDAVQEAHLKVLKKRPQFSDDNHCRNWVVKVAVRKAIDVLRRERRHNEKLEELRADAEAEAARAPSRPCPFLDEVSDALEHLRAADRRLIERRYRDNHTLSELSKKYRTTIASLWRRINRIIQELREVIEALEAVHHGHPPSPPHCGPAPPDHRPRRPR